MRYRSIDFYRGLTIAFMLIVNNPGTGAYIYGPLTHADWHGCSPTDLIFPSFLFIIGVSMWFSFEKYGRTLSPLLLQKIGQRVLILVALGLILNWFPFAGRHLESLRLMGVLQRLGLCYGIASLLVLTMPGRSLIAGALTILFGYWAILYFGGMPGLDPYSLEGNAVLRLDMDLLGDSHLWHGKVIGFDPEGLLSTFPAVVTVIFGWWSGQLMQRYSLQKMGAVQQLLIWGNILAASGLVWDVVLPMNKSLWTSSFVLYCAGLSMLLLAFAVWLVDIWGKDRKSAQPAVRFFEIFGLNALVAFVLSGLLAKTLINVRWMAKTGITPEGRDSRAVTIAPTNLSKWIYEHIFKVLEPHYIGSLLYALAFMLVCWLMCWVLYKRKIFVKI